MEEKNPWFPYYKALPKASFRVFLFHWAGGAASSFGRFQKLVGDSIECIAVQLPGRGMSVNLFIGSPNFALCDEMEPLTNLPFALFGHSLGSYVAFEAASELIRRQETPRHLFVSCMLAPHLYEKVPGLHISDVSIPAMRLWGVPEPFLTQEFLDLKGPTIQGDAVFIEQYKPASDVSERKLPLSMTVFVASRDQRIDTADVLQWKQYADNVEVVQVKGSHMLTLEADGIAMITKTIATTIKKLQ